MNNITPKTLKALEASIRHWERMASGKRRKMKLGGRMVLEEPQYVFCALCKAFAECDKCVVAKYISKDTDYLIDECEGTPYYEARVSFVRQGADSPEFKQAAQKEVDFLKEVKRKYFN